MEHPSYHPHAHHLFLIHSSLMTSKALISNKFSKTPFNMLVYAFRFNFLRLLRLCLLVAISLHLTVSMVGRKC